VLMPIFADQILHVGARGLGVLMGATGLGALIAALLLAMRTGVSGLGSWVSRASIAFGFTLIAFAFSRWYMVSAGVLVLLGFTMMMQMTASNTLIQSMVPDRLRGRVMSVYSMMFMGMAPIGAFSAGAVAHRLGAPLTLAIGGAACIIGAALFTMELPALRIEARKLILAQGMGTATAAEGAGLQTVVSDADVAVEDAAFTAGPVGALVPDSDRTEGSGTVWILSPYYRIKHNVITIDKAMGTPKSLPEGHWRQAITN
jgi:MFS family permease